VQTQKKNEKFLPLFRETRYYCRPNRLFLSMKNYLIAFAVFFAIAARANVALPGLMPSASEFQWEGWDIKIVGLNFTDGIKTPFGEKRAQEDSVFVYLSLMVKNNSDHGNPFIPQNNLKIIAGDNTFDAEDVEQSGENYIENIEPTLTRQRGCYFELPKVVIQQGFTLQLAGMLVSKYELHVSVVNPKVPKTDKELAQQVLFPDLISSYREGRDELNLAEFIEYYNLGYAKLLKGDYGRALGDYNKAIEIDPNFAAAYGDRGWIKEKQGDSDDAIADYGKAIELRPAFAYAYYYRGNAKDHKGDYGGAISDFDKAIQLDQRFGAAYSDRGKAKYRNRDYDGAIADCNRAIELNPKDKFAYNVRAAAEENHGDYNDAIADENKAIEIDPKFVAAFDNRGVAKDRKGDHDAAIADHNKAIQLDPKSAHSYDSRAWVKAENGDYAGAIADENKAIKIDPKYGNAFNNRAIIEELEADFESALKDFVQSDRLASKRDGHDFAHLRIWVVRARLGHMAEANQELSRYQEGRLDGNQGDWPLTIADFLLGRKAESEFLTTADSPDAQKSREQHCQAWYYAGMKQLLAGDKSLAADQFNKCLATDVTYFDEYMCAKAELKALTARVSSQGFSAVKPRCAISSHLGGLRKTSHSRVTSAARFSIRNPRNTGWRS
jgi:tetratricopeptide (TPR) repeat protein